MTTSWVAARSLLPRQQQRLPTASVAAINRKTAEGAPRVTGRAGRAAWEQSRLPLLLLIVAGCRLADSFSDHLGTD